MPVKPVKAFSVKRHAKESVNDYAPYVDLSNKNQIKSAFKEQKSKSNYEILSPLKRSSHGNHKFNSLSEDKRYSFASNFK